VAFFTIISDTNSTVSDLKSLYNYLIDFKNFASILPEDKVKDFHYSDSECSFTINGITAMTVKRTEQVPYDHILFSSEGLAKFNFSLKVFFMGEPDSTGQCKVELSGDLNPFIKTMAEKPLTGLINTMSKKLSELTF
jgi:hypothetical protein